MSTSHSTELSAALGWRFFAGIVTLLLGVLNIIDGLIAIVDPDLVRQNVTGTIALPVTDKLEVWGWVVLIVGFVMLIVAFPIMAGWPWARFAGIGVAGLDLVLEFAFLAHFPLWSLIMIGLNVLVIFGLAARSGDTELETG
jgi:hypothetical protein